MSDVTRDSYQDAKNYCRVTFQRNKDITDFELNEAQKIGFVRETKALRNLVGDLGVAKTTAGQVQTDGATNNTITVAPGIYCLGGYTVEIFSGITISGLTTPGGARTDCVWMKIDEIEVTSSADPAITTQALGETAVRQQVRVTFGVTENSTTPPANNGQPWSGGFIYGTLAHLYRSASAVVAANQIVDRRYNAADAYAIQLGNLFMFADAVTWDGTTLTFTNLNITFPQASNVTGNLLYTGTVSFTPADGDACGWDGTTGFQLRRNVAFVTDFNSTAGGTSAPMRAAQLDAMNTLSRDMFLLAFRKGTTVYLRSGVVLRSGDATNSLARQPTSRGPSPSGTTPNAAQMIFADASGNPRSLVDRNGFLISSTVQKIEESWERTISYFVNTSSFALTAGINATTKTRLWDAWDVGPSSGGTLNTGIAVTNAGMGPIGDGYVTISGNASVAGETFGITRGNVKYTADSVIEADFSLSVNTNNTAYNFKVGFTTWPSQSVSGSAQVEHAVAVQVLASDMSKLYLYTNNNGASGTATASSPSQAVPFTLAGAVRCRLELHGANTPAGVAAGGAIAKLYCNGALVATSQSTMPATGQTLIFCIALRNLTASVANGINVGPLKAYWNSSLAGDSN
ncbi:MAG: hypothetical protein JWM53_5995 [bacterium]|nr:hypothetical protein [bacterium]